MYWRRPAASVPTAWMCPWGHGQTHTSLQAAGMANVSVRSRVEASTGEPYPNPRPRRTRRTPATVRSLRRRRMAGHRPRSSGRGRRLGHPRTWLGTPRRRRPLGMREPGSRSSADILQLRRRRRPGPGRGCVRELSAQGVQDRGEQPGHLHLADPDGESDLALRALLHEPHPDDPPLSGRQPAQRLTQHLSLLDELERIERIRHPRSGSLLQWAVQGAEGEGRGRLTGGADVMSGDAERLCDLVRVRVPPQSLGETLGLDRDDSAQLLQTPWRSNGPAGIPEMSLHLAAHGERGERGEVLPHAGPVPAHCLDQAKAGHLSQILRRDAPVAVSTGGVLRELKEPNDDLVLQGATLEDVLAERNLGEEPVDLGSGGRACRGRVDGDWLRRHGYSRRMPRSPATVFGPPAAFPDHHSGERLGSRKAQDRHDE